MLLKYPLVAILFFFTNSNAQQRITDSLEILLNQHVVQDTTRINVLNTIAYYYSESDPEKGIKLAKEAMDLSGKLDYPKMLAIAIFNMGINLNARGDYNKAISEFSRSIKILDSLGEKKMVYNVQNSMAVSYMQLSLYPKALEIYFNNLKISEQSKNDDRISLAAGNISIVYRRMGKLDKAFEYCKRAIEIRTKSNDLKGLAGDYSNLGNIYDDMGDIPHAIEAYKKGIEISNTINYQSGIATNLSNLGNVFGEIGKYDSAIDYSKKTLAMYTRTGDRLNMGVLLAYLGDIISKAPDPILLKEGIPPNNRYEVVNDYFMKSLAIRQEIEDVEGQAESWLAIGNNYKSEKKFEPALEAYENYMKLKDSLYRDEKTEEIARIGLEYEFDKREDSIRLENEKNMIIASAKIARQRTIRNFMIAGALIITLAALLLLFSYKRRRDAEAMQKDAKLIAQKLDTDMKVMRLQMNPHFIFNTLNSISDFIAKNNHLEADVYLSKFAKMMRMTLENSEKQVIPLSEDLKMLEIYMQLEARRLENKFTFEITVGDEIDKENILVPPMIFQPFVENSIWHGIAKKNGTGKISIRIRQKGEMLHCVIEDDGIGRHRAGILQKNEDDQKQSMGMKITKARIDVLNKLKGSNATVQLIDKPDGLIAELNLPVEKNF